MAPLNLESFAIFMIFFFHVYDSEYQPDLRTVHFFKINFQILFLQLPGYKQYQREESYRK